jgi:hypothetical protein
MLLNETADPIELPGPESGIRSKRQGLQLELTCGFIPLHVNMHRLHTIEAAKRRSDMDREYPELMAIAPPLWVCQISDVSGDLGPGKSPYTGCGNDSEGEGARPVETLQGGRHGPENVEGPSRREVRIPAMPTTRTGRCRPGVPEDVVHARWGASGTGEWVSSESSSHLPWWSRRRVSWSPP